jgi:phytoene synthase
LQSALAELRRLARKHAEAAIAMLPQIAAAARSAFLHVALVPLYLDRMEAKDYDPFKTVGDVALWRRQWRLWRVARRFRR